MAELQVARTEFILGGQRSGKSRCAEALAQRWLAQSPVHRAVLIATAQPWDDEMRTRIARHQTDRAERVPGMRTGEEPLALGDALAQHSDPTTLVVVDCLTLWLTNLLMPHEPANKQSGNAENSFKYESNSYTALYWLNCRYAQRNGWHRWWNCDCTCTYLFFWIFAASSARNSAIYVFIANWHSWSI